jgi:hypothetical protein
VAPAFAPSLSPGRHAVVPLEIAAPPCAVPTVASRCFTTHCPAITGRGAPAEQTLIIRSLQVILRGRRNETSHSQAAGRRARLKAPGFAAVLCSMFLRPPPQPVSAASSPARSRQPACSQQGMRRGGRGRRFEKGAEPGPWGKSSLPGVGDIDRPLWELVLLQLANATLCQKRNCRSLHLRNTMPRGAESDPSSLVAGRSEVDISPFSHTTRHDAS